MNKTTWAALALICAATLPGARAGAITWSSLRLDFGNQPGEFVTGATDTFLTNTALALLQNGFTFQAEWCIQGNCSVPTGGLGTGQDLRLTNLAVDCVHPTCGGWVMNFFASGTLNAPVDITLQMDNMNWSAANEVFGLIQVGVTDGGTSLTFNSTSSTAGPSVTHTFHTLGAFTLSGNIQFVFPNGAQAMRSGDFFHMADSLVVTAAPVGGSAAPEPASWLAVGAGLLLVAKKKFACYIRVHQRPSAANGVS